MATTFRNTVKQYFTDQLATIGEVDIAAASADFARAARTNRELMEAFAREYLELTIRQIGDRTLKASRAVIRSGDRATSVEALREQVKAEANALPSFVTDRTAAVDLVPVPPREAQVISIDRLLAMTKVEVTQLAYRHRDNAIEEAATARWLTRIAARMDSRDVVGDILTETGLLELKQEALDEQYAATMGASAPRRIAS